MLTIHTDCQQAFVREKTPLRLEYHHVYNSLGLIVAGKVCIYDESKAGMDNIES